MKPAQQIRFTAISTAAAIGHPPRAPGRNLPAPRSMRPGLVDKDRRTNPEKLQQTLSLASRDMV
jgi:hypothetical protein